MSMQAVRPKGWDIPNKQVVLAELDRLGRQVTAAGKAYPAAMPWKSPTPKSGPRKGGRRTGALGKSIGYRVQSGNTIILHVESTGVRYATYVKGKRQTRNMASRQWKTFSADFDKYYPESTKRLQLWARLHDRR